MTGAKRLVKGMYGLQYHAEPGLFGLRCEQVRGRYLIHAAGWYNAEGEQLGWGDLAVTDFVRIARELQDHELFVVLSQSRSMYAKSPDYITSKACWLIAPGKIYRIDRHSRKYGADVDEGMAFERISPGVAQSLVERAAALPHGA